MFSKWIVEAHHGSLGSCVEHGSSPEMKPWTFSSRWLSFETAMITAPAICFCEVGKLSLTYRRECTEGISKLSVP